MLSWWIYNLFLSLIILNCINIKFNIPIFLVIDILSDLNYYCFRVTLEILKCLENIPTYMIQI